MGPGLYGLGSEVHSRACNIEVRIEQKAHLPRGKFFAAFPQSVSTPAEGAWPSTLNPKP